MYKFSEKITYDSHICATLSFQVVDLYSPVSLCDIWDYMSVQVNVFCNYSVEVHGSAKTSFIQGDLKKTSSGARLCES